MPITLTEDQIDFIVNFRKDILESEYSLDLDELTETFLEEGYNKAEVKAAIDFYMELVELGPAGMLEEYPDLDWSEEFRNEYGYYEDDEDFEDDEFDDEGNPKKKKDDE